MPFERLTEPPRRIAVIGGGISGMAAAELLSHSHAVVLFEKAPRLGGHARTVLAGRRGDQPVDTGFIVFNRPTYPGLSALFDRLGVPVAESDMSFGVSADGGRIEYGLKDLRSLFCQRRNLLRPGFARMVADILRFNANAGQAAAAEPDLTIRELLGRLGTGRWFRDYYMTPLSGAIWSTPVSGILDFPALATVRFLKNHGLMSYAGQHRWLTVRGGSVEYVGRLEARMRRAGVDIRSSAPASSVRRIGAGVEVTVRGGVPELFDEVVIAAHSDEALAILADPSPGESAALSAIRYQPNEAVLHADASVMPARRAAWASWVYSGGAAASGAPISLSYWMNSLQPIPMNDPMFVTLNPVRPIREDAVYDRVIFRHPLYTRAAVAAQERIRAMNGARATWFCGAWMGNGFHEDGLQSAADVVRAMAARPVRSVAA
ncbi:MAG: NAD(P)/FAD-dependent oxidoreductase [Paracoccaceae bacterium]